MKLPSESTESYILVTECFEDTIMHTSQPGHAHRMVNHTDFKVKTFRQFTKILWNAARLEKQLKLKD